MHVLYAAIAFCVISTANAHGLMSWPRQRGLLANNDFNLPVINASAPADYCPHCLNGGGTGTVSSHASDGTWTPYEPTNPAARFRDDHGMCGDPKGNNDHMIGGKFPTGETIAKYEQGDYIDFEAHVSAHHNGFFEFFLCDMDACGDSDISKKCFTSKHCYLLNRVPHKSCESGNDRVCGPIDPKYPGRWYLPPRDQATPENNWYGGSNKKMRYELPKDVTCNRCVLHWSWTTANSCNPPGFKEYKFPQKWNGIPGDGGSSGGINRQFKPCGEAGAPFPEEFWSCAENIRIVKKGQGRTLQIFHDGKMNAEGSKQKPSGDTMKPSDEARPEQSASPSPKKEPKETPSPGASHDTNSECSSGNKNLSKYDLSNYIESFDTGACVDSAGKSFCEACLTSSCGDKSCFWCTVNDGVQVCTHSKPK